MIGHATSQKRPYGRLCVSELFMEGVLLTVLQTNDGYGRPDDDLLRRHVRLQWGKHGIGSGLS